MSLTHFHPWSMRRGNEVWDPFMETGFSDRDMEMWNNKSQLWKPCVDVTENANGMMIHCELPGVKKDAINLDVADGRLTISGERTQEKKEEGEKFHRVERSYGKFQRTFAVPENCKTSDISAKFADGVLDICIPKPEKKEKPQKISIQ
ncbi:hypothetical protein PPL_07417 [Heterostelium album PN500]|uniref:SHSP domain-containing protein n=1 Tax=Heterostelium pallidum (strain ATCC 26659 / Pp 5 / PN500) TaxID=670386 RepID=D3BFW6_HETP5|nr:hypothetical protein PPL_07417 [Heterostelium album PN500]EFA79726.1 hypothetical protein PPL_07417 [Heterostelium album PN500]|eukprot:XP_020431847.1 hypothetical protein PPL_07417 [Heterostelium album PN500]